MADNEGREPPKAAPPSLSCSEVHEGQGKPTVLLVHGASSSGSNSWATVASHLDAHHLLLPDLPAHGKSKNILPFFKELSARLLANLIRSKATSGIAHIAGHSLGSHIAIELAFKYPEVVVTVFVSGFGVFSSPKALAYVSTCRTAFNPPSQIRSCGGSRMARTFLLPRLPTACRCAKTWPKRCASVTMDGPSRGQRGR